MRQPKGDLMQRVILPGAGIVFTLFLLFVTGAAAIAHEPLFWWAFMLEGIVLLGLALRLYHAMRELGGYNE